MNYDRNYKASVFSMLYEEKENVMDLYNGLYDEKCTDPEDITINTLKDEDGVESGIFARFKNDLSFIFGAYLNLFEHQSTINRNIPLRMLIYVTKLFRKMINTRELYRENAVRIPAPRFAVFYNGLKDAPVKEVLKLSSQYFAETDEPDLELRITVYNINTDKGGELLKRSRTIREYMLFVDRVAEALKGLDDEGNKRKAMNDVIDGCVKDGILTELLKKRREEIVMVSILNYDQAAHEWALHEDGYDEGHIAGYDEGHIAGYDEGDISRLIIQIGKKRAKGRTHQQIADEIEEEVSFVDEICSIAERIAPDFDEKKISAEYLGRHKS